MNPLADYENIIEYNVERFAALTPTSIAVEDLRQEAALAVLEALPRVAQDAGRYAFINWRVRGALLDYLRGEDKATRGDRTRYKEAQALADRRTQEQGRMVEATVVEPGITISIDAEWTDGEQDAPSSLGAILVDKEPSALAAILARERTARIDDRCSCLSETERRVLRLIYDGGQRTGGAAKVIDRSESRAAQLHQQALRKVRARLSQDDYYLD